MSNQKWAKIMAFLALLWIIVSIVWTGLLFLLEDNNSPRNMTQDELLKYYSSLWSWMEIKVLTWSLNNSWTTTSTWSTN